MATLTLTIDPELLEAAKLEAERRQTPAAAAPAAQPLPAPPADAAPVTTLKIATRLVAVSAIVRDKSGTPVTGLTRGDFVLKQDGKPQSITYFSQGSDLPLTLALRRRQAPLDTPWNISRPASHPKGHPILCQAQVEPKPFVF